MTEYKKVFIDTSFFIYLFDKDNLWCNKAENFLNYLIQQRTNIFTSSVTYLEFCVKPYKENRLDVIEEFKNLLFDLGVAIYDINIAIANLSAQLRSKYDFLKPMDAIQLGTSLYCECGYFMTNDKRLKNIEEINILILEEWKT